MPLLNTTERQLFSQPHGGNIQAIARFLGVAREDFIDFSANINPFGPPPEIISALRASAGSIQNYPELNAGAFVDALAARLALTPECLAPGNGSAELLYWLAAWIKPRRVLIVEPSFADYRRAAAANGCEIVPLGLEEENGFELDWASFEQSLDAIDLVIVGRPNNPTGNLFDAGGLSDIAARHRRTIFIVDEAFIDFVDGVQPAVPTMTAGANLIILRSLTKIYAIPGLRLGYLVAAGNMARRLNAARPPWPLGAGQIAAGVAALRLDGFIESSRERLAVERRWLLSELRAFTNLRPFEGTANFILIKILEPKIDSACLTMALAKRGIYVRDCASFNGLSDSYVRIAVRRREDNKQLVRILKEIL